MFTSEEKSIQQSMIFEQRYLMIWKHRLTLELDYQTPCCKFSIIGFWSFIVCIVLSGVFIVSRASPANEKSWHRFPRSTFLFSHIPQDYHHYFIGANHCSSWIRLSVWKMSDHSDVYLVPNDDQLNDDRPKRSINSQISPHSKWSQCIVGFTFGCKHMWRQRNRICISFCLNLIG